MGTRATVKQMTAIASVAVALMALAGCSASTGLSNDDIRKALADKLDKPSCFTEFEYQGFPVEPSTSLGGNDHSDFDALVAAGLAIRTGKLYSLTPAGRAAYHADRNGFCYSAGYEIVKVLDVAAIPADQLGLVADKAWTVTLSIAQKPLAAWVRTPAIAKRAVDQDALSTEPKTHHVVLAHFKGEDGIRRNDPSFELPSGFSY